MLPNHAPLTIAEQFGTLETLHPGRIDLGLGPGARQPTRPTMRALRRDPTVGGRASRRTCSSCRATSAAEPRIPGVRRHAGRRARTCRSTSSARRCSAPSSPPRSACPTRSPPTSRPHALHDGRRAATARVPAVRAARRALRDRRRQRDRRRHHEPTRRSSSRRCAGGSSARCSVAGRRAGLRRRADRRLPHLAQRAADRGHAALHRGGHGGGGRELPGAVRRIRAAPTS